MQFKRDTALEDELLDEMAAEFHDPDRSQPSVTGMIKCLTRTYYENEIKMDSAPALTRREKQLFYTGLALEKVTLIGRQRVLKGEYEGIQWHIDHLGTEGDFIELKSTRIKMVDDDEPTVSNNWQRQVLAYFKVLGITQGHFVMIHVTGDYKPPFPDIRAYNVVTTQEEVDANWTWIQQRAVSYLSAVKNRQIPKPFKWNEGQSKNSHECRYCPWLGLCTAKDMME